MKSMAWRVLCMVGMALVPAFGEAQSVAELVQGSEFRYTKGDIDVQALSSIIAERQKAIANDVLQRYLLRNQAASFSQNILNERLIDQLLNSHTPKEITKGIYTYTLETFALGMMTLALENSDKFELPKSCTSPGILRGQLTDLCSDTLMKGHLRPVFVVDSLLRLMKTTRDSLSKNAANTDKAGQVSIDRVVEVLARRSRAGKEAEEARNQMKSIWLAYSKVNRSSLKTIYRDFLSDLAFVIASDSNSLFKGTLYRNESSQGYLNRYLRAQIIKRWGAPSDTFYQALQVTLFEAAENQRKEYQATLRERTLLEYIQMNDDAAFDVWRKTDELSRRLRAFKLSCGSISESNIKFTIPRLIDSVKVCLGDLNKEKDRIADSLKPFENYERGREIAYSLASFDFLDYDSIRRELNELDSVMNDLSRLGKLNDSAVSTNNKMQQLKNDLKDLKSIFNPDTSADSGWRYKSFASISKYETMLNGKGVKSGIQKWKKVDSVARKSAKTKRDSADYLSNKFILLNKDIAFLESIEGLLSSMPKSSKTWKSLSDTMKILNEILPLAGGVKTPEDEIDVIRKVKQSLNRLVAEDSMSVKLAAEYDAYLSRWLLQRQDRANDTLAIFFLQKFLPALRKASFSGGGMKDLYQNSIQLIGFVEVAKTRDCKKLELLKPVLPWLANYPTRTRSQNLQSALQVIRENDSLFKELVPSKTVREWFWMVSEGLEIDTSKDIISVDIPRLLVKIDKKFTDEVKSSKIPLYPILDIGTFSAIVTHKDTTEYMQLASEKVGFGWVLYRGKSSPREDLIEDPYGVDVVYIEKVGLEAHASGLLYNSTNLKTNKTFNDAVFSLGVGVYLRLGLTARFAHGWGFGPGGSRHRLTQAAIDIPLADYLTELGKK